MKKILFLSVCLMTGIALAQAPADLLDTNNPEITGTSVSKVFDGEPVVLIEKTQKPQEVVNQAEKIPPPNLRENIAQVQIQTPFGHERTAAFIDHTPDYNVLIQVMDNKTIRITEQIQVVTTNKEYQFKRIFPQTITDVLGNQLNQNITILSLKRNNFPVRFSQERDSEKLIIAEANSVPAGTHHWTLEYLLSDAILNRSTLGDITISLTGGFWPLMTERFSAVLFWPQKTNFYAQEILFGENNVLVPGQVKSFQDVTGNTVFQMNRPIPAYADIKLHLQFDAKTLLPAAQPATTSQIVILIFTLVLIGYTLLSILSCRRKKEKRPLNKAVALSVLLWFKAINKKIPKTFLKKIYKENGIKIDFITLIDNDNILKIISFIKFNVEYIIGVLLLAFGAKWGLYYQGLILDEKLLLLFLGMGCISVFLINRFGTKIVLLRLEGELKEAILNSPHGLHPTPREVGLYYALTTCLGIEKEWEKRMIGNNPKYKEMPFFNLRREPYEE